MPWLEPVTLSGPHARLEPLAKSHHDGLIAAADDGDLSSIWYTAIPSPDRMAAEIDRRLALQAAGAMLPFTVRDRDGKIAGMTTYMNVDAANRRVVPNLPFDPSQPRHWPGLSRVRLDPTCSASPGGMLRAASASLAALNSVFE